MDENIGGGGGGAGGGAEVTSAQAGCDWSRCRRRAGSAGGSG